MIEVIRGRCDCISAGWVLGGEGGVFGNLFNREVFSERWITRAGIGEIFLPAVVKTSQETTDLVFKLKKG